MITLEHKVFELMTAKGEEAQVSDIANLKILINGYDNDIYVMPRSEETEALIKDAGISGNMMEGFSILERFAVKDGALVHKKIAITLWDEEKKEEILIKDMKAMHEISMWREKAFCPELEDEQAEEIIKNLTALALQNEESETKEQVTDEVEKVEVPIAVVEEPKLEEPIVETPEVKVDENKAEEPKVETPVVEEPKVETPVVEEPKVETPVIEEAKVEEPIAETTPVTEQTDKEIDENEIPQLVLEHYKEYSRPLLKRGYEEFIYKNYRFITNYFLKLDIEDIADRLEKHASYAILLTPEGVAIMQGLVYFEPVKKTDKIIKYRFYLDKKDKETRKYLYLDTENKTISIKKPKKSEVKADENKEEKPVETSK